MSDGQVHRDNFVALKLLVLKHLPVLGASQTSRMRHLLREANSL